VKQSQSLPHEAFHFATKPTLIQIEKQQELSLATM